MKFIGMIVIVIIPFTHISTKTITAQRAGEKIYIDGQLNEFAWQETSPGGNFTQIYPHEDTFPTESTKVWVLYDESGLYIGVRAYDSEPQKIVGKIARRDKRPYSDWIAIYIDSFHDKRTSFYFSVNPKGTRNDAYIYEETKYDFSWDPVWDVATNIDKFGWVAEFKIPWSSLRFPNRSLTRDQGETVYQLSDSHNAIEYTFGFEIERNIARKNEKVQWVYIPRHTSGFVRHFGQLNGIKGISPKFHINLLPYGMINLNREIEGDHTFFSNAGLDFKYCPYPNIILDGSINPDFGQVEADPSVLNLSAFETYFTEKRPFFIERKEFFKTHFKLFYSSRIGHKPSYYPLSEEETEKESPTATTILGAVKFTGKTRKGTTFGTIDAVTSPEYAVIDSSGKERKRLIEPLTNYGTIRVTQDVGKSKIGGIFTSVNRREANSAFTGGIDWDFKFAENYTFFGQIAESYTDKWGDAEFVCFAKEGGKYFYGNVSYSDISSDFEINDIGYLQRNDVRNFSFYLNPFFDKEWWIIRSIYGNINYWKSWNLDRLLLTKGLNTSPNICFINYWYLFLSLGHNFECYDDYATRGGPPILYPPNNWIFIGFQSDFRKSIVVNPCFNYGQSETGSWWKDFSLNVTIKPWSSIEIRISPSYSKSFTDAQWVTNIDTDGDGVDNHFIFGELKKNVFNSSIAVDFALTPKFTFELWAQPFVAVGAYKNFKELTKPKSYQFKTYELSYNPDFNIKTFKLNFVCRWEYHSGSTLYVVYSPSFSDYSHPGDFSFLRDLNDAFTGKGHHILSVKINYSL